MKTIMTVLGVVVLALAGFFAAIGLASELGGEVVTLGTRGADGRAAETRLWVVDYQGAIWLRAGVPTSGWFVRLSAEPNVQVERAGVVHNYRAVPVRDPETRDKIHELMAEKYPFADRLIGLIRDGGKSIPVRLDPIS